MQSGQAFQANGSKRFPKPIEKQKVLTCLKRFSEETLALKTNNAIKDAQVTITSLGKIIIFWKIVNCKGIYAGVRSRDPQWAPQ